MTCMAEVALCYHRLLRPNIQLVYEALEVCKRLLEPDTSYILMLKETLEDFHKSAASKRIGMNSQEIKFAMALDTGHLFATYAHISLS